MDLDLNYLAVLVAAVLPMVLGMIWYAPSVFGKKWMEVSGITPEQTKGAGKAYAIQFGMALLTALVMAIILDMLGANDWWEGVQYAFWLWLGFVVTTNSTHFVWDTKGRWSLYFLNIGFQLISFLAQGALLGSWN